MSDPSCEPPLKRPTLNFLEIACPSDHIQGFLKSICRRVFPYKKIWGTRHNLNLFMSSIDHFIQLQRSESLSVSQVSKGYKLKLIPWIDRALSHSRQQFLFHRFMFWLFSEFLVAILAANFYVTEGEGTGTQTLYYKKSEWKILEEIGREQMNQNFMKVSGHVFFCLILLDSTSCNKYSWKHRPFSLPDREICSEEIFNESYYQYEKSHIYFERSREIAEKLFQTKSSCLNTSLFIYHTT